MAADSSVRPTPLDAASAYQQAYEFNLAAYVRLVNAIIIANQSLKAEEGIDLIEYMSGYSHLPEDAAAIAVLTPILRK